MELHCCEFDSREKLAGIDIKARGNILWPELMRKVPVLVLGDRTLGTITMPRLFYIRTRFKKSEYPEGQRFHAFAVIVWMPFLFLFLLNRFEMSTGHRSHSFASPLTSPPVYHRKIFPWRKSKSFYNST